MPDNYADEVMERVDLYYEAMVERYGHYLDMFFPVTNGSRQPLFTTELDEREEYLFLQEAERKAMAAQAGMAEPDTAARKFMEDADGAQARLAELRQKFGAVNA